MEGASRCGMTDEEISDLMKWSESTKLKKNTGVFRLE